MSLLDKASLIVTPNSYKESKLYSVVPSNGTGDMDVVRTTTATRVNSSGLIESVAVNVPRIDYTNGSCPSLLVEGQRTNSILYSEQFDNATWTKRDATVTSNNINSPSGLLNADFIIPNTTNTVHSLNNSTANVTSGLCTYSIFAKKGLYKNILVWFDIHSGGIGVNLETLAIFRNTNITSYKIDNYGNEWVRISITANIVATALPAIYIYSNDTTPQISWAANGTGGLYVWGAQVEKTSSYATSYIPTVASTVTRNADVISKTGISSLIGVNQGTFCYDIKGYTQTAGIGQPNWCYLENGSKVLTFYDNGIYTTINGSFQFIASLPNGTIPFKVAYRWNASFISIFVNGIKIIDFAKTSTFNPTSFSPTSYGTNSKQVYNSIIGFNTALTDQECIALTTL
jgi:hypothetical protein